MKGTDSDRDLLAAATRAARRATGATVGRRAVHRSISLPCAASSAWREWSTWCFLHQSMPIRVAAVRRGAGTAAPTIARRTA